VASLEAIETLRGQHNVQNALAALTALRALADVTAAIGTTGGATDPAVWSPDKLRSALQSFPGLAHRLEIVGQVDGVLFVNDSKATNAEAAEKALLAFDGRIHWIAGGVAKDGGISSLEPLFGRVASAHLIGEAAPAFGEVLRGHTDVQLSGTLERAVADSFSAAQASRAESDATGPVVLLSPACASFDQYKNFEVRGDAFKQLVQSLPGFKPVGGLNRRSQ
ncbi:MAG: cyanophycin synthetase, partial [Pseudomonadota bacterium]